MTSQLSSTDPSPVTDDNGNNSSNKQTLFIRTRSPIPHPSQSPLPFLKIGIGIIVVLINTIYHHTRTSRIAEKLETTTIHSVSTT
jgi:hypothetical protein